jgi:hypothetical protein
VLGWCLWQKRRLEKKNTRGTGLSTPFFTYPVGNLLTAILSMWVIWQLLFGPGSEQITYGIIAPSAAWAVMVSFQQRKNHGENGLAKLKTLFQRGWTILAWLILGLFGMGDIEHPLVKLHPAAIMLLPLGLIMFGIWLVIYDFTDQDSRDLPGLPSP